MRLKLLWLVPVLGLASAQARGEPVRIGLGLYLPGVPVGRADRVKAIEHLATYLRGKTGYQVHGLAFARRTDLETAAKDGAVHFAIVPAEYAANRRLEPLGVLVSGGAHAEPIRIVAKSQVNLVSLKGQPLAVVRTSGAFRRFVTNVLLEGELSPQHFRWVPVPDTSSAVRAVKLGKAAAAVVPARADVAGLPTVFVSLPLPLPGIVSLAPTPAAVQKRLTRALAAWKGGWLGFDGWRRAGPRAYASVRRDLLAKRVAKKPIAVKPELYRESSREVLAAYKPSIAMPTPLDLLEPPKHAPDRPEMPR